jgi:uncharacterized Zn finger protein/superfamily II DNA or RNA helicase
MVEKFGNTWWGKEWLNSLKKIDYDNRLPRGATYARKGNVINIEINKNRIEAKVQGHQNLPYKVVILIPEFKEKEKKAIIEIITGNPLYISKLISHQIPSELNNDLLENGINIFPSKWADLKAGCSCPDIAIPCKHIASVIYTIANEIDRNPFLIFNLHNFDIVSNIKNSGYEIHRETSSNVRSIGESMCGMNNGEVEMDDIISLTSGIDFSKIPSLMEIILSILPEKPLFYLKEDFKRIVERSFRRMEENIEDQIEKTPVFEGFSEEYTDVKLVFNTDLCFCRGEICPKDDIIRKDPIRFSGFEEFGKLVGFIESIPRNKIYNHGKKIITLYFIYYFTIKLLKQSGIIPCIFKLDENRFAVKWIPFLLNEEVKNIYDALSPLVVCNFIYIEKNELRHPKGKKNAEDEYSFFNTNDELKYMISLFADYFFHRILTTQDFRYDPIKDLFFRGKILEIRKFSDKELPNTINLWLSRFFIIQHDLVPILKIDELLEGFDVEVMLDNRKNHLQHPIKLSKFLGDPQYSDSKINVIKCLNLLMEYFPEINVIISSGGKNNLNIPHDKFQYVFFKILPVIRMLGINVLMPKSLKEIVKPKLVLALNKTASPKSFVNYLSLEDLIQFNWKIAIGDDEIPVKSFMELVKKNSGIVKIKDKFVLIDHDEISKILKYLEKEPVFSKAELLKISLEEEIEGLDIEISGEVKKIMNSFIKEKTIALPDGIAANLREYQKRGYEWLYKNIKSGFGSIIADDMGLGKTLQVITILLKLKEENYFRDGKVLIVVPTTLITNWQKEIAKFAPALKVHVYHGHKRELRHDGVDIIITTYGIIRNEIKSMSKINWACIVIDEAQNIKNSESVQSRSIKNLNGRIKIAMSGTPIENRLMEYWSIFDFVNKGYLGNQNYFKKHFAMPIEREREKIKLDKFKNITSPFVLRRLKTDKNIIKDLPEKIEMDDYCYLSKEQASLYQNIVDEAMNEIKKRKGIERKGLVFKLMTSLKQICNHPVHFLKKGDVIPESSGKVMLLLDILEDILSNGEKVLIFTQYREMGDIISGIIRERLKIEGFFIHGGVARNKRDRMVDNFQNESFRKIMILSLKAAGTGLNLTAATNVIHFDLWWNPAVEAQATDRAYRIGQRKNVIIRRFITQGTFEEKIDMMLKSKKDLAVNSLNQGEKWIGEMSDRELNDMFKL